MSPHLPPSPPHDLTVLGLWLLEVPFEPASPSSGELFDDILETASAHLISIAMALAAHGPPPTRPVLHVEVDASRRRREQHELRRTVAAGRLPVCTSSLREAEIRCVQAVSDLTHLRGTLPPAHVGELGATTSLLATCARICAGYRRSAVRFHRDLATGDDSRVPLLAARAERDLVRRLTQAAGVAYGPPELNRGVSPPGGSPPSATHPRRTNSVPDQRRR